MPKASEGAQALGVRRGAPDTLQTLYQLHLDVRLGPRSRIAVVVRRALGERGADQ